MKEYEIEMRKFFDENFLIQNKVYFGDVLIGKLNEKLNVKITYATNRIANQYTGFLIEVINKTKGEIDSVYIEFSDIIGKEPKLLEENIFYLWECDNKLEWYGSAPTSIQREMITETINKYLNLYK